jgi:hypothetical protein
MAAGSTGLVYVAYGPIPGSTDLPDAADATLRGDRTGDYTGRFMTAGGDMTGDGIGDILVPTPFSSLGGSGAGLVYVVESPVAGDHDLAEDALAILVGSDGGQAGSASDQADVDGDGLDDAVVGAYAASSGAGRAYVMLSPLSGALALDDAEILVEGERPNDWTGFGVAARDLDADHRADLLIGAAGGGVRNGVVSLFYGIDPGVYAMSEGDARFRGETASDYAGMGVAFGDVDGDSNTDVIVGAPYDAAHGSDSGAVYVVYPEL